MARIGKMFARQNISPDLWVITPVILLKLLFLIAYPLNISGDGYNYYVKMFLPGRGFLVHADGYPFWGGMFLHNFMYFSLTNPVRFEFVVSTGQHLFDLFCLIIFYFCIKEYLGQGVAVISLYFCGLSTFYLQNVSMFTPVWFQGDLWMLFLVLIFLYARCLDRNKKALFLGLSVIVFFLAYLVRYNSMLIAFFYAPILFVEMKRRNLTVFFTGLLGGAGVSIFIFIAYLYGFHYPTTGTTDLHYDSGWVLVHRVNSFVSISNGINSKRMFALNGVLPDKYNFEEHFIDMWRHVDEVPQDERQPYRDIYHSVMRMDESELDKFIEVNPLRKTENYVSYVLRVQYYVGLKEGDDLGKAIAYEAARSNISEYIKGVIIQTVKIDPNNWIPRYIPDLQELNDQAELFKVGKFGSYFYKVPYYSWNQKFRTIQDVSRFWDPGLKFLNFFSFSIARYVFAVINIGLFAGLYQLVTRTKHDLSIYVLFLFVIYCAMFKLFSISILSFRASELHPVMPLIGVCVGISVKLIVEEGRALFAWKIRPKISPNGKK